MTDPQAPAEPTRDVDLREIPRWAERYAANRALPVLLSLGIFSLVAAAIAALSVLAGLAWVRGERPIAALLAAVDIALCIGWVWVTLTGRLAAFLTASGEWLYRREGEATVARPQGGNPTTSKVVGWGFAIAVIATVYVAGEWEIPIRYLQPITCLYTVPFMVYLSLTQNAFARPFMLLWPGLYALHGILVLVGVPLLTRLDPMLAVILPMNLYGVVAILASHIYSRYALHRLRQLTRVATDQAGEDDESL